MQHSILENSANQQFSECKKLLHALGTLIRNCSPNTKTASAIIKILDIFFHNNEIAERQSFTCDQLKGDLERDEAKEAISEMVRLGKSYHVKLAFMSTRLFRITTRARNRIICTGSKPLDHPRVLPTKLF